MYFSAISENFNPLSAAPGASPIGLMTQTVVLDTSLKFLSRKGNQPLRGEVGAEHQRLRALELALETVPRQRRVRRDEEQRPRQRERAPRLARQPPVQGLQRHQ